MGVLCFSRLVELYDAFLQDIQFCVWPCLVSFCCICWVQSEIDHLGGEERAGCYVTDHCVTFFSCMAHCGTFLFRVWLTVGLFCFVYGSLRDFYFVYDSLRDFFLFRVWLTAGLFIPVLSEIDHLDGKEKAGCYVMAHCGAFYFVYGSL